MPRPLDPRDWPWDGVGRACRDPPIDEPHDLGFADDNPPPRDPRPRTGPDSDAPAPEPVGESPLS